MTLVLDASVILKWLLKDPAKEADTDKANRLVQGVAEGQWAILQPVHWLAEVCAVLARLSADTAPTDVEMLHAMELPVADDPAVMRRATRIAVESGQHLFDTLYHAVALEHEGATLITADERYRRKAQGYGRIVALARWEE